MSKPIELYFTRSGSTVIDLSVSGATDVLEICFNYSWILSPVNLQSIVGDPLYTFQISATQNSQDFRNYKDAATDVSIQDAIDDVHFSPLYARILINDNSGSGTSEFKFVLKK